VKHVCQTHTYIYTYIYRLSMYLFIFIRYGSSFACILFSFYKLLFCLSPLIFLMIVSSYVCMYVCVCVFVSVYVSCNCRIVMDRDCVNMVLTSVFSSYFYYFCCCVCACVSSQSERSCSSRFNQRVYHCVFFLFLLVLLLYALLLSFFCLLFLFFLLLDLFVCVCFAE